MERNSTYVIAEAGVNHNGSVELAIELVEAAADARADAVKFQTFVAEKTVSRAAPKAHYQTQTTGAEESQLEMVRKLELSREEHARLAKACSRRGIQFLSTPFDVGSVDLLVDVFDIPIVKIASGEITNAPLMLHVARKGKPVILSTGMSTLGDVEEALGVLAFGYLGRSEPSREGFRDAFGSIEGQRILSERVTVLHCTTEYPAPVEHVNLRAMDTLGSSFGLRVGLSDHSEGIAVPIAAVARGAAVIEKHFTLDRNMPGPDHLASLEPGELTAMVEAIRTVEQALGSPRKLVTYAETGNRRIARKSLVAARAIPAGTLLTSEDLDTKRPGEGISPMEFWSVLGTITSRAYDEDDPIEPAS